MMVHRVQGKEKAWGWGGDFVTRLEQEARSPPDRGVFVHARLVSSRPRENKTYDLKLV